jgi:tight adherence protein B
MVGTLTPFAIVLGGAIAAAFIFSSIWTQFVGRIRGFGSFYKRELDLADMKVKSQDLGFVVVTIAALVWIGLVIVVRPSVIAGLLYLPMVLGFSGYGVKAYLRLRTARRIKAFRGQLEGLLRSLASGVRVGLGLRQALLLVAEQSKDPARRELTRVIGAANLGTSLFDALDEMGRRMPLPETQMLARVMRVQAQSGGNLAEVLEGLAETIRDRRRLERKIAGLISQSRATAWLLGLLPVLMCAFMLVTQPMLRTAVLTTGIGQGSVILGLGLDAAAVFFLFQLTKLDA